ncbi:hypothetical protein Tsubulata_004961 [Turnera subulata]|uniref:ENT domain-containing protein n=1 Tax=Turnera subulata TaxID=218843 RepID=A0A9Q0FBR3_9ROSI|nr:hypothetical protein Tsubulata_004961 [Turnera subulata]
MKFKKGYLVEVLRREDEPCGSWFPGSIVSADGNNYLVRYDSIMGQEGEAFVEKVHSKDVRPRPPLRKVKRWMVGDVAEMFDFQCWRVGKIAKELENNVFVVKLVGSIQLKEFHGSEIRIQQAWHENKWSVTGKVASNEKITENYHQIKLKHSGSLVCSNPLHLTNKDPCSRDKIGLMHLQRGNSDVKMGLHVRKTNAGDAYHLERSSKGLLSSVRGYKKSLKRNLPWSKLVEGFSSQRARMDEKPSKQYCGMDSDLVKESAAKWLCTSSSPLCGEDSNRCSVASCGSNDGANSPIYCYRKSLDNTADNSDAESSIPSVSVIRHFTPHSGQNLEANIHKLEFHAYRSTVQALYASGPLSWEQESLLTNLRLSLHISDEEHLQHLRKLLSTQVL